MFIFNQKSVRFIKWIIASFSYALPVWAHEQWLLSPSETQIWNQKPPPTVFSQITLMNLIFFTLAILFLLFWIIAARTKLHQRFSPLEEFLKRNAEYGALFIRWGTGIMLLISAFGLIPRRGNALFTPTVFAPDLVVHLSNIYSYLIICLEILIGIGLIIGLYVRLMTLLLFVLLIIGCYLFQQAMFPYLGFYLGIISYLLLQGGGRWYLPLKPRSPNWLCQPVSRAQFLLRIGTGISFLYAGIGYKFLQPNLALGILEMNNAFTFGISYAVFVLGMAFTETIFGILILLGFLIRPLAIILVILFTFLSLNVSENMLAHSFIYGILFAFILNGSGSMEKNNDWKSK